MSFLNWASITLSILLAISTAGHALFHKRTPSSALGWVAVCLMFPFVGPFLYFLFGVNRVETRAKKLEDKRGPFYSGIKAHGFFSSPAAVAVSDLNLSPVLSQIALISDKVSNRPLVGGNRIDPLHNGEAAYPAMLQSIESAKKSLYLMSYIFDTSKSGWQFIEALSRAAHRGVDVRVIIDGVGEFHSLTRAGDKLDRRGVRLARFLEPTLIPPAIHINLRNHRKIMIADGQTAYTGGMNISDRHLADNLKNRSRVMDVHFRLMGPIVTQLEQTFLDDWAYCTGEQTDPTPSLPVEYGTAICRAITDGPNEDIHKLSTILIGAVASAHERIWIMTPYFLPSAEMVSALQTAALRGIEVNIVLPSRNNLPFIKWAAQHMMYDLLYWGVRIFFQPPPFVHSKLFVIDDHYAQIGSANIDSRSLRLNFELTVEIYDPSVAQTLSAHIKKCALHSKELTLRDIEQRPILIKTRDALTWLFSPYL
ncbi:MAG: cardiolipin synthase [Desulfobacterales bacterium]|jgi:cardiolipin synthase|nr:cardiolipin synthase [Desulfobacterales bacterium]